MKEEDAKEKWCLMARYSTNQGDVSNRWEYDGWESASKCLGSECMMWRFIRLTKSTNGYCGLAGKVR